MRPVVVVQLALLALFCGGVWLATWALDERLRVELRSADSLVVTVGVGAPAQRVVMALQFDGAAIVVAPEVLEASDSFGGAIDFITLGARVPRLMPVRAPATSAEVALMDAGRAQGILGLGPQSPIWAFVRCVRLSAGALLFDCPSGWARAACGPPDPLQPDAWCLLPELTVGVPGEPHRLSTALADAVLHAAHPPAFTLGPFVVRNYERDVRARNVRLARAVAPGEFVGLSQRLVFDYELALDGQTRTLYWRAMRVTPHLSLASALFALLLALALYFYLLVDERHLQPLYGAYHIAASTADVPLTTRFALSISAVLLVVIGARLALNGAFWALPLGAQWAFFAVYVAEALVGLGVALHGAFAGGMLSWAGQPLAVEVGIWAGVWLALAEHTTSDWLDLVAVGIATVLVVVRVRRAFVYYVAPWSAREHVVAALYIYGGAYVQLFGYCVFVGVPGAVAITGLPALFVVALILWAALTLVCACAYYAHTEALEIAAKT